MSNILKIVVNNNELVLFPNTKIKFKIKTPYFNHKYEYKSQTYTFQIPVLPNQIALDLAQGLNRRGCIYEFPADLYIGTTLWKKVVLLITGFNNIAFSIKLVCEEPYYIDFLAKNIRDFQYLNPSKYRHILSKNNGEFKIYTVAVSSSGVGEIARTVVDTSAVYVGDPDRYIFYIEYENTDTSTIARDKIVAAINNQFPKTGLWATPDPIYANDFHLHNMTASPWSEFDFSIEDLLKPNWVDVTYSGLSAVAGGIPAITTALAEDTLVKDYDFIYCPVYNPPADSAIPGPNELNTFNVINDFEPDSGKFYSPFRNRFAPFPYLKKLLKQLYSENNIVINDTFFDEELSNLILYTPIITAFNNGLAFDQWPYFQYSKILPNVTVQQFYTMLRGYFGFIPDYNYRDRSVRYTSLKQELNRRDFKDLSNKTRYEYELQFDKQIPNYNFEYKDEPLTEERMISDKSLYYFIGESNDTSGLPLNARDNNAFYIIKKNHYYFNNGDFGGTYWYFLAEAMQGIFNSTSTIDLGPKGSIPFSLEMYHRNDIRKTPVKWLIPFTKSATIDYLSQKNEIPFRLMFYRGMSGGFKQSEGGAFTGFNYPFASYHNYNYAGTKVGNYSLAWNAPDGLFEVFFKEYDSVLRNSRPVNFITDYDINDVLNFDELKPILRNNQAYIIDEIEFEFTDKIEPVKSKEYIRK